MIDTVPKDIEAEQAVLGAVIANQSALEISDILTPESFYSVNNQEIFRAMLQLQKKNQPIDEILIADELKETGVLEKVGGYNYLSELEIAAPVSGNINYYASIIKEHETARNLIKTLTDIQIKTRDPRVDIQELIEEATGRLAEIQGYSKQEDYHTPKGVFCDIMGRIEEVSKRPGELIGIPTRFTDLDKITLGLQPSDLIIVAARPSMGKTAFAMNIATNIATNKEIDGSVVVFSLEMSREQLMIRALASESRIDSKKINTGKLTDEEWDRFIKAADNLSAMNLLINDQSAITIQRLSAIARKISRKEKISAIVVDYMQLMAGTKKNNREQEIAEISRGLKELAKDLNIPVIALSQLNRSLENRSDKRPKLSDLRESGAIEQDADIILFIYRDEVYDKDSQKKGIAEILISKHRNGPIGEVELAFKQEITKFTNLSRLEPPPYMPAPKPAPNPKHWNS